MFLVTGATGNVGSELVRSLARAGDEVRAWTRASGQASLPAGVEGVTGDLDDPGTLSPALTGVRGVFLMSGFRDMPGVLAEIRRAGVQRVVQLSGSSAVASDTSNAISRYMIASETAVRESGAPWTILRPRGFMSNVLQWAPQLRGGDVVRAPFAGVRIAVIDPYDIAAVAAQALRSDAHEGQAYPLTGPESLLPADRVRTLGAVLDRELRSDARPAAAPGRRLRDRSRGGGGLRRGRPSSRAGRHRRAHRCRPGCRRVRAPRRPRRGPLGGDLGGDDAIEPPLLPGGVHADGRAGRPDHLLDPDGLDVGGSRSGRVHGGGGGTAAAGDCCGPPVGLTGAHGQLRGACAGRRGCDRRTLRRARDHGPQRLWRPGRAQPPVGGRRRRDVAGVLAYGGLGIVLLRPARVPTSPRRGTPRSPRTRHVAGGHRGERQHSHLRAGQGRPA